MRRPCSPIAVTRTLAPKCLSIFSVWSRVASFSITVVAPGAASPASSTADLSCADGTGASYSIGIGSRAPCSTSAAAGRLRRISKVRAPIFSSGSRMRRIGRVRRLASPSNVAVIGQPATAPITSRQPVPELPKSSAAAGSAKPPTPTPRTRQARSPVRSTTAPSAFMALAVLMASSPSSMPVMRVSPTASAPRIRERSEIDLSPGTRTRPVSAPERRAVSGEAGMAWFMAIGLPRGPRRRY